MMRSPRFIAVAVRRPNHKIILQFKPYESLSCRYPFLKKPVLRGVVTLLESMIQGMGALSFSAEVASNEDSSSSANQSQDEGLSRWAIAATLFFAFIMGIGLFVALPHGITVLLTSQRAFGISVESPLFHLIDGGFKVVILLSYIFLIGLMKDIHRVFQYHGAEHKSIYTFEAGEELTVENARKYTTLHPRCGTSFLLFLVLISVVVFSIVFPLFGLSHFSVNPILNHGAMILVKMGLMFPVSGIAYEFIKACAYRMDNPIFRGLIWPGMVLQNLTTREPDEDQLEVALASLRQVLRLEESHESYGSSSLFKNPQQELEILGLSEITNVKARVGEFLEV